MPKVKKDTKKEKKKPMNEDINDGDIEIIEEGAESSFAQKDPQSSLKKLKDKLKMCQKERQEFLDGWQRAQADFANFKKENDKILRELKDLAKEDVCMSILPVIDSFEMAFSNVETWEKVDENWRKGVEYIYSQLVAILNEHGFKQIEPLGEVFDPSFHTSIETMETMEKKDDGKILDVIQKGYTLNGKTVRPARVKVGEYKK